ncbi:hypothetical protein A2U01_0107935, partial [Trifolium medium]|nr:hypothetical protein [Trifolium medium]
PVSDLQDSSLPPAQRREGCARHIAH